MLTKMPKTVSSRQGASSVGSRVFAQATSRLPPSLAPLEGRFSSKKPSAALLTVTDSFFLLPSSVPCFSLATGYEPRRCRRHLHFRRLENRPKACLLARLADHQGRLVHAPLPRTRYDDAQHKPTQAPKRLRSPWRQDRLPWRPWRPDLCRSSRTHRGNIGR